MNAVWFVLFAGTSLALAWAIASAVSAVALMAGGIIDAGMAWMLAEFGP